MKVLTMHQFEKENMESKIVFVLMVGEVDEFKEKDQEYLIEVQNILNDFSNLWLVELLDKLPLMHDIQHSINLLMTHNYFEDYQLVSQHWKVF